MAANAVILSVILSLFLLLSHADSLRLPDIIGRQALDPSTAAVSSRDESSVSVPEKTTVDLRPFRETSTLSAVDGADLSRQIAHSLRLPDIVGRQAVDPSTAAVSSRDESSVSVPETTTVDLRPFRETSTLPAVAGADLSRQIAHSLRLPDIIGRQALHPLRVRCRGGRHVSNRPIELPYGNDMLMPLPKTEEDGKKDEENEKKHKVKKEKKDSDSDSDSDDDDDWKEMKHKKMRKMKLKKEKKKGSWFMKWMSKFLNRF